MRCRRSLSVTIRLFLVSVVVAVFFLSAAQQTAPSRIAAAGGMKRRTQAIGMWKLKSLQADINAADRFEILYTGYPSDPGGIFTAQARELDLASQELWPSDPVFALTRGRAMGGSADVFSVQVVSRSGKSRWFGVYGNTLIVDGVKTEYPPALRMRLLHSFGSAKARGLVNTPDF